MKSLRLAVLLFASCATAEAQEFYGPDGCEFHIQFPTKPETTERGMVQTPQGYLPWLAAQCWATDEPGVLDKAKREHLVRKFLVGQGADNVILDSFISDVGSVTRGAGEKSNGQITFTFSATMVVGKNSYILAIFGDGKAIQRNYSAAKFFSSISRKNPSAK